MASVILLELLTLISLVYSLFLLFISFAASGEMFLIFIWTVAVALLFALGSGKSRWWELIILLMPAPLLLYNGRIALYFILGTAVLTYMYVKISLLRGSHEQYAGRLKKTVLLFMAAAYFRSLPFIPFSGSMVQATPFVLIYVLSSIILIRSIRHLESGMEPKRIKKANARYLLTTLVLSSLTAFEGVRNFLLSLIQRLPDLVIYPIYYLASLVQVFYDLITRSNRGSDTPWEPGDSSQGVPPPGPIEEIVEEQYYSLDIFLDAFFGILLLVIVIYIFYRLMIKAGGRNYRGLDYIEEREYINTPKQRKRRPRRDKYPAEIGDQIRYYYRRFLDKLARNKVEIRKSDTSREINEKAEAVFADGTEGIRAIYVESRYGGKPAGKAKVAEMEKLYKQL